MYLALHVDAVTGIGIKFANFAVEVAHAPRWEDALAEKHGVKVARAMVRIMLPVGKINQEHEGADNAFESLGMPRDELFVGTRTVCH